ncbi:MAG TPA: proton-conducting transporter membrane subunit [Puia sp.]|nr:proton-conducting transporter membrane subunit [Puia sp.]
MRSEEFNLLLITPISIFLSLVIIPFLLPSQRSKAAFGLVLINIAVTSIPAIHSLVSGITIRHDAALPFPFGDVAICVDPLAAWFMLIINLTCLNGVLYGIGYMKPYEGQGSNTTMHWISYVTFQVSMLWVCMLQHGLAFLVAWEIMSVSSFLLVIFEHAKPGTLKAGMNYLVQMHIGVALLGIAFIAVYAAEGSFDFSAIGAFFGRHSSPAVFLLFFAGFGIKAGFIPLHTWLPHAHPAAPSHISGVMSGVIVKLGIYGIMRMSSYLHAGLLPIGEGMLVLSVITAFYGILNAAVHRDIKRMLAFCTVENIGIIGMGMGIGLIGKAMGNPLLFFIGFAAALLHTLNHSLYKSLLFFAAGNVYRQTHTRDMEQLGGLIRQMPVTAVLFLGGSLAISALPPFNGFVSEFLLYSGLVEGIKAGNTQLDLLMILSIAGLAMVGGLSMLTFTKSFGTVFLGVPRAAHHNVPGEVPRLMRIPLYCIMAGMLLIGLFPGVVVGALAPVVGSLDPGFRPGAGFRLAVFTNTIPGALASTGRTAFILLLLIALVYYIRSRIAGKQPAAMGPTWGCGYVRPNVRMQYTGKSYTKSLAKLFSFLTAEKKRYAEITDDAIFPAPRSYQSHYSEFFETRIIDKPVNRLIGFINNFRFIHNGQTQTYVLYGLFFIVALIVANFLNLL